MSVQIEVADDESETGRLQESEKTDRKMVDKGPVVYGIDENPPVCLAALLALQNAITAVGSLIFVANVLAPKFCILPEDPARAYLLSTTIMMAGIGTLFQTLVGVRLPVLQNSGFVFMTSTFSILSLQNCSPDVELFTMGTELRTQEWQHRVRNIQGSIIIVGIIQMFLGYSGLVGKALKYITPLTVVPTMCIIGLSVIEKGMLLMSGNWMTSLITLGFLTLFSQYLRKCAISIPMYLKTKVVVRLKIFAMFSILFSVGIMWIACIYMTSKDRLLPTNPANTESKSGLYHNAQIFRIPYPFQWGLPKFEWFSIMAMLPALFTSIVESVGNYYMCAKFSNVSLPPKGVVNRGIGVQGVSSILAGFLGIGSGISTSSENIGNIGITRVCSRNVIMYAGLMMILISPFTKVVAVMVSLPDPILGAVTAVLLTLITAVALSNLQFINLNSIRNMYILGMSLFFGLALPKYVSTHDRFINTKYTILNDIGFVYLSSGMFIGGLIGFILDNTIPDDSNDDGSMNLYQVTANNKFKNTVEKEDEKMYKISDKIYQIINSILFLF